MEEIEVLLQETGELIDDHLSQCQAFLNRDDVDDLTSQWQEASQHPDSPGFNLFHLVSNYQRENLHSDVIAALLDPAEEHDADHQFLHLFIDWLKQIDNGKLTKLRVGDFKNVRVLREKGRIDILIYDGSSNRAIVIENKISNAVDQERQI
ncbi:MAG: PD-(D/E)XK nuclease family protein, partial [Opitutales bacterium]